VPLMFTTQQLTPLCVQLIKYGRDRVPFHFRCLLTRLGCWTAPVIDVQIDMPASHHHCLIYAGCWLCFARSSTNPRYGGGSLGISYYESRPIPRPGKRSTSRDFSGRWIGHVSESDRASTGHFAKKDPDLSRNQTQSEKRSRTPWQRRDPKQRRSTPAPEHLEAFNCMPLKKMVPTCVPLKRSLAPMCH
jgi:hypothetical protein